MSIGTHRVQVLLSAGALLLAAGSVWSQDRARMSVLELMEQKIAPASNAIFDIAEPPATSAAWVAAGAHAATLKDAGVLLKADRDDAGWVKEAQVYLDVADRVLKATDSRNFEALTAASDQLAATCIACHSAFLNKK